MTTTKVLTAYGSQNLKNLGFKVFHNTSHRRVPKTMSGFSDFHLIHEGRQLVVYAELKGDGDRIKKDQQQLADMINAMRNPHIIHRFIESLDDWDEIINYYPK